MNHPIKAFLRLLMTKTVRNQRILAGPLRGKHIVTSWHDYPAAILGRTERPLLCWLEKNVKSGETWLDIGAHYGYTAIALSELVGRGGRVFAFEPMLSTVGYLAQTRLLNNLPQLTVLPLALAAVEGLQLRQLHAVRGMVDSTKQEGEWVETILVACLEWLWPRICDRRERIDGIKIDVQGMEIEVLRGMPSLLKVFKPKLVVEFHRGVDRKEFLDLVKLLGYSRRGLPIEPVKGEIEPQYLDDRSYAFQGL